jgi:D-glycero-alpha-D-manno-heptose-7-phosphate kinase
MIISRTPFRISLFGGGTDYPAWYREHGGAVLASTIDKYCYLTCRYLPPFFEHRLRVVYSKIETCESVDDLQHPAAREVLKYLQIDRGVEIHHDGDLPARSGMGSSSAFTVGLLHALYALKGQMPSKQQLALESIKIEQEILKETVGSQDQVLAAYGGLNHIVFEPSGEISVRPMTLLPEALQELNSHLMLFYTGIKRTASEVAQTYVADVEVKKRQLRLMKDLVVEALAVLNGRRALVCLGQLLHEAWEAKRSLSPMVSNRVTDEIYAAALAAGALGGKLTGAGGGGFMVLFAPPTKHDTIREALGALVHVPFSFEYAGSQVIFFSPERDYANDEEKRRGQTLQAFRELNDLAQ